MSSVGRLALDERTAIPIGKNARDPSCVFTLIESIQPAINIFVIFSGRFYFTICMIGFNGVAVLADSELPNVPELSRNFFVAKNVSFLILQPTMLLLS